MPSVEKYFESVPLLPSLEDVSFQDIFDRDEFEINAHAIENELSGKTILITGAGGSIDILLDMNVEVTVAIGKKSVLVKQILQLGPGSVLKLDKPIDSPADLYLRGTKFATGNIVVVDGRFAVKIKNVIGLGNAEEEE